LVRLRRPYCADSGLPLNPSDLGSSPGRYSLYLQGRIGHRSLRLITATSLITYETDLRSGLIIVDNHPHVSEGIIASSLIIVANHLGGGQTLPRLSE
jgi:hypothetical protein